MLTNSGNGTAVLCGTRSAYLPALEESERRADVGNPVDPLELAALLGGLVKFTSYIIKRRFSNFLRHVPFRFCLFFF